MRAGESTYRVLARTGWCTGCGARSRVRTHAKNGGNLTSSDRRETWCVYVPWCVGATVEVARSYEGRSSGDARVLWRLEAACSVPSCVMASVAAVVLGRWVGSYIVCVCRPVCGLAPID